MIPGLLLGVLILVILGLTADLRQVGDQVRSFQWELYPLVLCLTLFNYILRFVKWQYYLHLIGVRDFPARESARQFVAGFPLVVTPGKLGEVLKAVWLQQKTGIPTARGVAVVLAVLISDGLAVLMLSTLGVIASPKYWPIFLAVLVLLVGIVIVSQIRSLALYLLGVGEKFHRIRGYLHPLREFYEGSYTLFRPATTLLFVLLGMVSWLGEGVGLYVILRGLGVAGGWQSLSAAVFAHSFSNVLGAVSTLPGGLGVSEASITGILNLMLGLPTETAAAATLLIRLGTLWFGVGLGLISWLFSRDLLGLVVEEEQTGL